VNLVRPYDAGDARRDAIVEAMKGHVRAARLDADYDADIEYMGEALVALVDEQMRDAATMPYVCPNGHEIPAIVAYLCKELGCDGAVAYEPVARGMALRSVLEQIRDAPPEATVGDMRSYARETLDGLGLGTG
jgi:flavoprotein